MSSLPLMILYRSNVLMCLAGFWNALLDMNRDWPLQNFSDLGLIHFLCHVWTCPYTVLHLFGLQSERWNPENLRIDDDCRSSTHLSGHCKTFHILSDSTLQVCVRCIDVDNGNYSLFSCFTFNLIYGLNLIFNLFPDSDELSLLLFGCILFSWSSL